jgi:membrane protein DedA with SNARE-associated domain
MFAEILKVLGLFLFSGTKFMMAPGAILAAGYGWWESIIISFTGGSAGSIFFYKLGGRLFSFLEKIWPGKKKTRKQFTTKNRIIIRLKNKFGVVGLAFLIPLISIPVSALLSAKYFRFDKKAIPAYIVASAFWSVALTFFSEPVVAFIQNLIHEI